MGQPHSWYSTEPARSRRWASPRPTRSRKYGFHGFYGSNARNTMNTLLQEDAARRPDIFYFFGPIPPAELDAWLNKRKLTVPDDLKQIWCETGGGDLFESETILGPYGKRELADDLDSVNEFHRQKGMPADWLLFHTGLGLTVVRISTGEYASLREGSYQVERTFSNFADWYANFIRKEYAQRYGLP
jgi:hypothetical protein